MQGLIKIKPFDDDDDDDDDDGEFFLKNGCLTKGIIKGYY